MEALSENLDRLGYPVYVAMVLPRDVVYRKSSDATIASKEVIGRLKGVFGVMAEEVAVEVAGSATDGEYRELKSKLARALRDYMVEQELVNKYVGGDIRNIQPCLLLPYTGEILE